MLVARFVASPVFLAALVTILPGMAILWYYLKRYEGMFQDAKMFFGLITGFFAGLFVAAFEFYTNFGASDFQAAAGVGTAFLFFVVGYAFFETGIKSMILGLGRFRTQRDTPYYGVALGMGMGAMVAMMIVANAFRLGEANGTPYTWLTGGAMVMIPVGGMLAHGATGAWVGKGSADGKLWKGWGIGTILQIPILGAYWLWWPSIGRGDLSLAANSFTMLLCLGYGIALLVITQNKVLDHVVPKDIRDKFRRAQRREARAAMAGNEEE